MSKYFKYIFFATFLLLTLTNERTEHKGKNKREKNIGRKNKRFRLI